MNTSLFDPPGERRQKTLPIRIKSLRRLAELTRPEVVVIGGGVNGVATLRDLALNGVSCVLLDTGDFCAGASGASSRMAHGGLRYLEGREFRLVAEAARERNRLIRHASHLVQPLEIMAPLEHIFGGFARSVLRFLGLTRKNGPLSLLALEGALWLYERFGRQEHPLPCHKTSLRRAAFPVEFQQRVRAVVRYFDGQISQPEGLILEMLAEALDSSDGVAALNHVRWSIDGSVFMAQDCFGSGSHTLQPRVIVNASGAWIDRVNSILGCNTRYVRGVKGAHLILDNAALAHRMNGRALYFDDGTGRMVIALPVADNVLVGTTEIETGDPDDKTISAMEIDYLLKAINRPFPDISVDRTQIISITTGIRPLRHGSNGSANRAARDHTLEEDFMPGARTPLLSLVGGKWTTFRAFAEQAGDCVLTKLGRTRHTSTAKRDYPGAVQCEVSEIIELGEFSRVRAEVLIRRYGAFARAVARVCAGQQDRPLSGAPTYSHAEIKWLIDARAACTIEDIVLRRTQLTLGHGLQRKTIEEIGEILCQQIKRDPADIATEIQSALADPRIMGVHTERKDSAR